MAKFFVIVALFVFVDAARKHHPKFPKGFEDNDGPVIKKVSCNSEHDRERGEIIQKSRCGAPKEVFVYLEPPASYIQVNPGAVWVKRCVGLCDYETYGSKCIANKTVIRHIPVRIYNVKTNMESCSTYPVEEHESCRCCSETPEGCGENRVFNPRKCSCQCPNNEERRSCLLKRSQNLRWNRFKCTCERRRRVK